MFLPTFGVLGWAILDPSHAPVHLEVLYAHVFWSLALFWWLHAFRYLSSHANVLKWRRFLRVSNIIGWPLLRAAMWYLLDPTSASAHSQVLFIGVFSYIWLSWLVSLLRQLGDIMDALAFESVRTPIHVGHRGHRFVLWNSPAQIEAVALVSWTWFLRSTVLGLVLLVAGTWWSALGLPLGCVAWTVVNLALEEDSIEQQVRSTACYLLIPWLIVMLLRLAPYIPADWVRLKKFLLWFFATKDPPSLVRVNQMCGHTASVFLPPIVGRGPDICTMRSTKISH